MRLDDLRQHMRDLGAKPCHEEKVLRAWAQGLPFEAGPHPATHFLPLALRDALDDWLMARIEALATLKSSHPAEDEAVRLLRHK